MVMNTLPVIAGVEITTDDQGRFNLNALHKASNTSISKKPSEWLRTKTAESLINELSGNSRLGQKVIETVKGGTSPGTFAHELLAISYAGWISPAFQLSVNQTFLDYKAGKLAETKPKLPDFNDPAAAARAWADQFEQAKLANEKLEVADQEIQRLQGVCHTIAAQFTPGMTPAQFCRQLNGVNVQQVQNHLAQRGLLIKERHGFKAASYYRDNWFAEKVSEPQEGIVATKVVLTKKGAVNLYKFYLKGDLPMKANWDGSHTHCLFDDKPQ